MLTQVNEHVSGVREDDLFVIILELEITLQSLTQALAKTIGHNSDVTADDFQSACYELAFASAEIAAAKALFEEANILGDSLSHDLAKTFAVSVMPDTILRMQSISVDIDRQSQGVLESLSVILRAGNASFFDRVGRSVLESGQGYRHIETNEEVDLAREMFWRFGQDVVAPLAEKIHRHDLTIPEEILTPFREMGTFGLSIPEKYGGHAPDDGENTLGMIAVTEALSTASLGAAGSLITRPEILSRAILKGGTEDQKKYWLPKLASGKPLCAISITEPDYGSDVANLSLRATKTKDGWLLNGAKTWCTFAGKAGVIMVVARTGDEPSYKGLSILLVEKPTTEDHEFELIQDGGGKMTGKAIPTIGYRGMHSFDMSYEDFFVPDANLLGGSQGLGRGFYMTMAGMTGGRIQTAARACGVMAASIDEAIKYGHDRKVFGTALGEYQLTKKKIAIMAARYRACRALAYSVAKLIDQGEGRMQASLVKLIACRSAEHITREAIQIFGGMGYAEETPVSRYFVDARVLSIFEGAEETLAIKVVARELLKRSLATTN